MNPALTLGRFYLEKVRANQRAVGTTQAAKNLRKQGVPLEIALLVLAPSKRQEWARIVTKGAFIGSPLTVVNAQGPWGR